MWVRYSGNRAVGGSTLYLVADQPFITGSSPFPNEVQQGNQLLYSYDTHDIQPPNNGLTAVSASGSGVIYPESISYLTLEQIGSDNTYDIKFIYGTAGYWMLQQDSTFGVTTDKAQAATFKIYVLQQ